MRKQLIYGIGIFIIGLLIALGPQFLFKVCDPKIMSSEVSNDVCSDDGCGCNGGGVVNYSICHWTARAELGMGMLIAALGICLIVFNDPKTQIGLTIGIFLVGIMVIGIPHALIGGCKSSEMACRRVAFPALTIEGVILLIYSTVMMVYNEMKKNT